MSEYERESELTAAAELLGFAKRGTWPPDELAPGVELRRRKMPDSAKGLRQATGRQSYVEPVLVDPRPYYSAIALHNFASGDDKLCPSCRGAGHVRDGTLFPGHPGFGALVVCPRWRGDAKRCVFQDERSEPWWSK